MNNELLKKARMENGLTQEEMAEALGYKDKSSYCLIENGVYSLPIKKLRSIKEILHLSEKAFNEIFLN